MKHRSYQDSTPAVGVFVRRRALNLGRNVGKSMLHCRTCVATTLVLILPLGPSVITNVIQSEWPLPGNE
jgi:hypothetical protein